MVGDAGVERSGRHRVDDSRIMGLLLVPLAVRVNKQGEKATED